MIEDLDTIVPCSQCGDKISVRAAMQGKMIVPRVEGAPERGVYIFCTEGCKTKKMITLQVSAVMRAIPPIEPEPDPHHCEVCHMPRDECECEQEW